jgi:uncharacterized protein YigA (DUF484 family)
LLLVLFLHFNLVTNLRCKNDQFISYIDRSDLLIFSSSNQSHFTSSLCTQFIIGIHSLLTTFHLNCCCLK